MTLEREQVPQENNENPYDIVVVLTANELLPEFQKGRASDRARNDVFCNLPLEISGGVDSGGVAHGRIRTWPISATTFRSLTSSFEGGKRRYPQPLETEKDILDFFKEAKKIEPLMGQDPLEVLMGKLYTFGRARNTFLTDSTIDRTFRGPFEPRVGRESQDQPSETQFARDIAEIIRDNRHVLLGYEFADDATNTQFLREFEKMKTADARREILTLYLNMWDNEAQRELITRYMEDNKGMRVLYDGDNAVGFVQLPESEIIRSNEDGSSSFTSGDSSYSVKVTDEGFVVDGTNLPWFAADIAWSFKSSDRSKVREVEKVNGIGVEKAKLTSRSGNFAFSSNIEPGNCSSLLGSLLLDYYACIQTGTVGRGMRQKDILKDVYARRNEILTDSVVVAAEKVVKLR